MQILYLVILFLVIIFLVLLILAALLFSADLFFELPYVSTSKEKINTIIQLAQITKGETAIDLGSGDGRLLLASAKAGAKSVGYEINPLLLIVTYVRKILSGQSKNIKVKSQNLWKADLQKADVIFVYGRKKTMKRFEDFIYKKAKKGTRILVNSEKTIPFPTKKALKSKNGISLYKI